MDKQERIEEIEMKCRTAGCNEARAKRHYQLFVYERWDPHPPDEFREWSKKRHEDAQTEEIAHAMEHGFPVPDRSPAPNAVTAWNSDVDRQAFYKIKGEQA